MAWPSVAAMPCCSDSKSKDALGVATVFHPLLAELSALRASFAPSSLTSLCRASTRTTKMSTLLTWSVGKGASVSRVTRKPDDADVESEQAIASPAAPSASVEHTLNFKKRERIPGGAVESIPNAVVGQS